MKQRANRRLRESRDDAIFGVINVALLGVIALVIIYPLIFVVSASFSDAISVTTGRVYLWPVKPTFESYTQVFNNKNIMRGYSNSLIILGMGTAINLIMTTLCAFPLSRRDVWGRNLFMMIITFTMFFSGGMIPMYLLVTKTLALKNNWLSLILPGAISTYNMIIMRTFISTSIPYELQEAAQIDGCTPFGTLLRIILPLSGPILAVLALYYGVSHWNAYFSALLYIQDRSKYPLQLFLREILVKNMMQMLEMASDEVARQAMRAEVVKYSIIVISSVPMLIVYPFVQRFFVKGVMVGSVKG